MPHIHEEYDFAVSAFIAYGDKTLLVYHPRYEKWLPVGGHVELNEEPEEALHREIKEECGLEVEILAKTPPNFPDTKFVIAPDYIEVHPAGATHKHIALVYFAKAKNDKSVLSAEHTDMKWFTAAEIDDPKYGMTPSIRFYAHQSLEKAAA